MDCKLIPIAKVWQIKDLKATSEKVGFVFPLYWSELPKYHPDVKLQDIVNQKE